MHLQQHDGQRSQSPVSKNYGFAPSFDSHDISSLISDVFLDRSLQEMCTINLSYSTGNNSEVYPDVIFSLNHEFSACFPIKQSLGLEVNTEGESSFNGHVNDEDCNPDGLNT